MLNMMEKILLGLAATFSTILTVNLILALEANTVQLITEPEGPYIRALAGKPFNISCEGTGDEESKFSFMKWQNSAGSVITERNFSSVIKSNKLFLSILNPSSTDSGTYNCFAVYKNQTNLQYGIYIDFYNDVHPSFLLPFENVTAAEGIRLILQCHALGAKPMTYAWYTQDEDRITENASMPIFVSNFEDHSLLTFEKLRIENEGLYTCTANNTYGLDSKTYLLQVTSSNGSDTNATSQFRNAKVVNVTANSVQFHIATSGPVEYIEVKYTEKRDTSRNMSTLFKPEPGNVYRFDNLVPGGLYNFQFRTIPSEGSDWSKVYQVTMLPDVPEVIFHWMDLNSVTLAWFRSTDDILRGTIDSYEIKYSRAFMQSGGNSWKSPDCEVTVQVPTCMGYKYTIAGLIPTSYYQIEVRAHTAAGYGEANRQRVYLSR